MLIAIYEWTHTKRWRHIPAHVFVFVWQDFCTPEGVKRKARNSPLGHLSPNATETPARPQVREILLLPVLLYLLLGRPKAPIGRWPQLRRRINGVTPGRYFVSQPFVVCAVASLVYARPRVEQRRTRGPKAVYPKEGDDDDDEVDEKEEVEAYAPDEVSTGPRHAAMI